MADVGETDNGFVVPTVVAPSDQEKADGVGAVLPLNMNTGLFDPVASAVVDASIFAGVCESC